MLVAFAADDLIGKARPGQARPGKAWHGMASMLNLKHINHCYKVKVRLLRQFSTKAAGMSN